MKSKPTLTALLFSFASLTTSQAALLVYEPFDYVPNLGDAIAGAQNGKNGGIGLQVLGKI